MKILPPQLKVEAATRINFITVLKKYFWRYVSIEFAPKLIHLTKALRNWLIAIEA